MTPEQFEAAWSVLSATRSMGRARDYLDDLQLAVKDATYSRDLAVKKQAEALFDFNKSVSAEARDEVLRQIELLMAGPGSYRYRAAAHTEFQGPLRELGPHLTVKFRRPDWGDPTLLYGAELPCEYSGHMGDEIRFAKLVLTGESMGVVFLGVSEGNAWEAYYRCRLRLVPYNEEEEETK